MHTFVFDGDEQKDFIRGIGLRFDVPLRDAPHDRHVRFGGEAGGLWAEGVRNLTGLRRDPGEAVRKAQLAGLAVAADRRAGQQAICCTWSRPGATTPCRSSQPTASGSASAPRRGHGWIDAAWGHRAPGLGYIGGATGGLAFGLRDFWQRHPDPARHPRRPYRSGPSHALDVVARRAGDGPALLSRRHGHGHPCAKQLQGLDITYEDYEKGFGTPVGVARSSEIMLWALASDAGARAPGADGRPACRRRRNWWPTPGHILATRVFGNLWSLPDRIDRRQRAHIEDRLDCQFDFYRKEVDQRRWYGFWDYGDVTHTYDADRHEWRYDVGGLPGTTPSSRPTCGCGTPSCAPAAPTSSAWPKRWCATPARSTSITSGASRGLGSRHNVQHWGCSAKQVRISTAVYRRFYYYLTADERVGDVMREPLDADQRLDAVDPVRKLANQPPKGPYPVLASFGTDWALAGGELAHRMGAHRQHPLARPHCHRHARHRRHAARLLQRRAHGLRAGRPAACTT